MENDLFELKGKTAVITGGGGVLCRSMALHLAKRGVKVAILDRRVDAAASAAKEVTGAGGVAMAIECDVLDRASLAGARDEVLSRFGNIDILLNGAGGNSPMGTTSDETLLPEQLGKHGVDTKTFFDLDADGFRFVFNLNFLGTLLPTQVFAEPMAEAGKGVIVNVSSMNAFRPLTKIPAYSAAKAAVSNFTQWLAVHLAPVGVRVNAMAPGFFLTDQNRFLLTEEGTGDLTPRGNKIIGHTPMARFGVPDDLNGVLVWLCSDASAFVTGVVVPVDGGFSAYSGV
jgi:NAD(P)-dependent dehydrogenase (short-subunit alcohol dehydrogenase family)